MPCVELKTTIAATGNGVTQGLSIAAAMESVILAAGGEIVGQLAAHGTGNVFNRVYRLPKWDAWYSRADYVQIHNSVASATLYVAGIIDFDPQTFCGGINTIGVWEGAWPTGGSSWPGAGSPTTRSASTTTVSSNFACVGGTKTWDCHFICSEIGFYGICTDGTGFAMPMCFRPLGDTFPGRNLAVSASVTGSSFTIAAPSGNFGGGATQHLRVLADGKTLDFDLTITGGTIYDVAQMITMQSGGTVQGYVIEQKPTTQRLGIRIAPDRVPSAGVAGAGTQMVPVLAVVYQDPELPTANIDFRVAGDVTMTTVNTGTRGNLDSTGADFIGAGARIGGYVYNQTIGDTATVVAFGDGATSVQLDPDNMYCGSVPGTWTTGHVYDVLPYCNQAQAMGAVGGVSPAVMASDVDLSFTPGGSDVTVYLTSLAGELKGQIQPGQTLKVCNNASTVGLNLGSVTGASVEGELFENLTSGAVGIVRAIKGSKVWVDTLSNSVNPGSPPWNVSDTVVSAANSGGGGSDPQDNPRVGGNLSATISSIDDSSSRGATGWDGVVTVVGTPDYVDEGNGDYRLAVVLDANDPNLNASLQCIPGFTVGVGANDMNLCTSESVASLTGTYPAIDVRPAYGLSGTLLTALDVRREEVNNYSANEPTHTPDTDTGLVDMSPIYVASTSTARGHEIKGSLGHIRSVNVVSNGAPVVGAGDDLLEGKDNERHWFASGVEDTSRAHGAGTIQPAVNGRLVIGPGSASFI